MSECQSNHDRRSTPWCPMCGKKLKEHDPANEMTVWIKERLKSANKNVEHALRIRSPKKTLASYQCIRDRWVRWLDWLDKQTGNTRKKDEINITHHGQTERELIKAVASLLPPLKGEA